jgi:hypothetical protein
MAQIKKKFIQDSAVDGAKILLLNNQALRAKLADGSSEDVMKVDASGVLKLLKLPQLSVDPVVEGDVARKGYVDSVASTEAAARTKADVVLQAAIDSEKARVDAILSASDADKDSFAEIVSLINSVDSSNDSAFAGYVTSNNAALAQEVKDREAGDTALDGRLDIVEGADTVVGSISKALKDAKAYTDSVSSGVSGTLSSDLAQEIKDRAAGDVALDGRLDIIEGAGAGSVAKAQVDAQAYADGIVTTEAATRTKADNAITARLDIVEGADSLEGSVAKAEKDAKDYADGIVTTEAATRSKADTDLQANITTEKNRIDAILLTADADKDSFAEIVSLINSVDTTNDSAFGGYVTSNNAALAQEIKDRAAGDVALDGRLDIIEGANTVAGSVAKAEKDAKDYADAAVAAEAAAGTKADGLLDGRLDILEADPTTKAYVDGQITTVTGDLNDANGAITDLQSDVTALEAKVFGKETKTMSAQNNTDGYIDLAFTVEANSLFVFTNSLFLGEGEDYLTSVVAGKTRVTWINDFAAASVNAFESGEKVFFQYRK